MFTNFLRNRVAAISVAGALAVGLIGGGAAFAMTGEGSGSPAPASAALQVQTVAASTTPGSNGHTARKGALRGIYRDIVKQSGLTSEQLKTGFKAGQSIDDLITANGGNPATVQAAVATDVANKVQAAVAANKLTQKQADAINTKAPKVIDALMSAKGGPVRAEVRKLVHAREALVKVAATTLNITPATLRQDMKSGQTIAQVAGNQAAAVISAGQAKADAAIDAAVTSGKISSTRAATLKTKANDWIANFVNNGPKHRMAAPAAPSGTPTATPGTNS